MLADVYLKSPAPHVLVIGDVMLDVRLDYKPGRDCPERPVLKRWDIVKRSEYPGGAANVAANLLGMGARATLVSFHPPGAYERIARTLRELSQGGGRYGWMQVIDPARIATVKTRLYGPAGVLECRFDEESVAPADEESSSALADVVATAFKVSEPPDAVVVSDYAKGMFAGPLMRMLLCRLPADIPVLVDPKRSFESYGPVDVIKPNRAELSREFGDSWAKVTLDDPEAYLSRPVSPCGPRASRRPDIVATDGANGCVVCEWTGKTRIRPPKRDGGDPTGCGDSFMAALAYGTAMGWDLPDAARLATAAGAAAVDREGTYAVRRDGLVLELMRPEYNS